METNPRPSFRLEDRVQWNSPVFIIGIAVAAIVIIGWVVTTLMRRTGPEGQRIVEPDGDVRISQLGEPVNYEKAAAAVQSLSTDQPESTLLTTSSLRTSHGGLLTNMDFPGASNPTDTALILELSGRQDQRVIFELTQQEVDTAQVTLILAGGVIEAGSIRDMQLGDGVSLTRIRDLLVNGQPDQIILEVTRQAVF